jgi:predicted transcriptional regulator
VLVRKMPGASPMTSMEAVLRVRASFAAKVRAARAALGLKQSELAKRAGLTQKSIHRIEHGTEDLRRSTIVAVESALRAEGIEFEEMAGGGFKVVVSEAIFSNPERKA